MDSRQWRAGDRAVATVRVVKASLGYPAWMITTRGQTVYVVVDRECPDDEAATNADAALEALGLSPDEDADPTG
jgi:hypothetical protein